MQENITLISAKNKAKNYWLDVFKFRDLLFILAKRDVKVRYKQTILGAAWGIVRPLFTLIGFAFVFKKIGLSGGSNALPYPILAFSGIIIWTFFSNAFLAVSNSLLVNTNMVSKVYFPRIIMPISSIFVVLVDFLMGFILYLILMFYFKVFPQVQIFLLPFAIILGATLALGLGLIFASLNIKYRDFGQLGPFLIQFGLFICPVAFTHESRGFSPKIDFLYSLNPVVGIIDFFRWCLLPNAVFPTQSLVLSLIVSTLILTIGIIVFRKSEDSFVDHI